MTPAEATYSKPTYYKQTAWKPELPSQQLPNQQRKSQQPQSRPTVSWQGPKTTSKLTAEEPTASEGVENLQAVLMKPKQTEEQ